MNRGYRDPWADVGRSVNNAAFRYLSSRNNPTTDADIETKRALANKYNLESQQIQSQLDAPSAMSNIFRDIYSPYVPDAPSPEFVGPMPSYDSPPADVLQQRYQENIPQILSNAMQYAGNDPKNIGEIFATFVANAGASPEQITNAQLGSGIDYAKTRTGFEADPSNTSYTLSPGSIRFDAENKQLASAPFKEGLTGPVITLPDGTVIQPNESTGNGGMGTPNIPSSNLYDKAGRVGGVVGALSEGYANTLGQFLPIPSSVTDTVRDRQDLVTSQNNLVRALSINPRMPVAEIKRILAENPIEPSMFRGGESSQAKIRSLQESFVRLMNDTLSDVNDPSLPSDVRDQQYKSAKDINRFLRDLNVPSGGGRTTDQPRRSLDEILGN